MADATQSYNNHRRYYPVFHFVTIPLLVFNLVVRVVHVFRYPGGYLSWWDVVVAIALILLALAARAMILAVQDRLIRLEETLRLQSCLPADLRSRVGELSAGQLISLRFCGDEAELAGLVRSVLSGELKTRNDIKKSIKTWRPDTMRA